LNAHERAEWDLLTAPCATDALEEGVVPGWQVWLEANFPQVCSYPFAPRHVRLWEWIDNLTPGVRPKAYVAVWPRGGAKSTTIELACAFLCVKLTRRFVLYVSETQAQANKHVQAIATNLEHLGVGRSINQYGASRGWKMDMLRTANGFNVVAFGLDAGARGVKLDQFRPDFIVLDDIDGLHDTAETRTKKRETITHTVLPAGSEDAATAFVQNAISEDSLMSEQADGRADWLMDKEPVSEEPAILGLEVASVAGEDGLNRWQITDGTPTWAGQGIAACEQLINLIGLQAFRRECQHEVAGAAGTFFDVSRINYIDADQVPKGLRLCRAWDLAGTEGGGDHTSGPLGGMEGVFPDVAFYVIDVERGQWGTEKVSQKIEDCAKADPAGTILRLPQDPAQAGKAQANQFEQKLKGYRPVIVPVSGKKSVRARGFQECLNKGNVYFVKAYWNHPVKEVLRKFQEDVEKQADDDVDALSDAFNELAQGRKKAWAY
jgi:predicted phage terminase large subunit-like protein